MINDACTSCCIDTRSAGAPPAPATVSASEVSRARIAEVEVTITMIKKKTVITASREGLGVFGGDGDEEKKHAFCRRVKLSRANIVAELPTGIRH